MVSGLDESLHLMKEEKLEDQPSSKMEIDNGGVIDSANVNTELPAPEKGEGSNVVFSRESPLLAKDHQNPMGCKGKEPRSRGSDSTEEFETQKKVKNRSKLEKKLCKQERIELGRVFQGAVSSHDWENAESLICLADPQTLNDALCITLDSTWFLTTRQEVNGTIGLLRKIVANGAHDFTRALLRTSFLASCVAACRSSTMSVANTVNFLAQRLRERLQECNGDEKLKAEAGAKAQKFTEWALKCIGFHSQSQESRGRGRGGGRQSTLLEIHLQLLAFKAFLGLADNNLTGKDFSEAVDAACFPLTLFSTSFDTGWASGIPAASMQGLLGLLVEGGADNVNQCFLEASWFGSTELVHMLLQIAQRNSLDVDVDLALGFASHYSKITTMECLVEEGHTSAFLGPLMRAAERGAIEVVQWFVNRGCRDMELCLALSSAISNSQIEVAAYLLPHVPHHVLSAITVDILKMASERSSMSHDGVAFLLRSDFLGDPTSTYAIADSIARAETNETAAVGPELRAFLKEHWSEEAFWEGVRIGEDHYVNFMRVLTKGRSGIVLNDLPPPLVTAVVYLPLYRECVAAGGGPQLLSQRLRGELVEAVRRLGNGQVENENQEGGELLRVLEHYLHPFLIA